MKYSEYVEIVKNNGEFVLKKVVLKILIRKLPFLAVGPMNYLAIKFATWLAEEAANESEMRVFFIAMELDSSIEGRSLKAVMIQNNSIQKIGTEDEKKNIEAQLEESLNKFINLYR